MLTRLVLLCVLLTGCSLAPDGTGGRLDRVAPQGEYFSRAKPEVFAALVEVLESMGYSLSRKAAAQGIIEAAGPLLEGRTPGMSRQFFLTVRLRDAGEAITGLEMLVREAEEGDFKAGAVSSALSGHGRYESIFSALETKLGAGTWMPPSSPSK
jgi:hypothetical protein